jgi:hypothetical protein
MMIAAAMLGWALGYGLAAATRSEPGPALYVPVPSRLVRFLRR